MLIRGLKSDRFVTTQHIVFWYNERKKIHKVIAAHTIVAFTCSIHWPTRMFLKIN